MFEKVSMYHPDKIADRIAGAIVDLAYTIEKDPRIAVEVLIGHGRCHIIAETSVELPEKAVFDIVLRIAGRIRIDFVQEPQDIHLAENQEEKFRCGDNGIAKCVPETGEEKHLASLACMLDKKYPTDGKYLLDENHNKLIVCQSNAKTSALKRYIKRYSRPALGLIVNPLGDWSGGTDVDCGATNRKIGSDLGDSATGGGLHGKDLSKADVSVQIYAWLKAQDTKRSVEISYAIGDDTVDNKSYDQIMEVARDYIERIGGFEKLAEYGLVR